MLEEKDNNMNFIRLKKDNIIKIGIIDANGNDTKEYLEFDLEDIELPLRYQEALEEHKKNVNYLKQSIIIIDKKKDHKGKKLLSFNQEEKVKVYREFFKREMKATDLFLGEGGTTKLLNGRKPYMTMFEDINEMINPILPILKKGFDDIGNKLKEKYKSVEGQENVLK